jgi:superfamily II DNA/RNA helicase
MVNDERETITRMSFSDLGLSEKVLNAVTAAGYSTPTPIQAQAIPHVLEKRDVLGIAQTGTGKTAAFTLPMLTLLEQGRARARMPRTLILEPTRELAAQVEENFNRYGAQHKLSLALLIGGVSFGDQDAKITRGVDVLIATPGRLLDHFERGKLLLTGIDILVIDEADRMLDMGFIPDIERICKLTPFTRQTLFFTATMPPEIGRIADQFLSNPIRVEVARPATAAATITQLKVASGSKDFEKRETLRRILAGAIDLKNAIIFCNRKRDVSVVVKSLERHGFSVAGLHGDMDQRARMATLDAFRAGRVPLMVASDVAARGLDIPEVSHVVNYDVPIHADDYVHRIGRTGRAGRTGTAFSIVTRADDRYVDAIEKLTGKPIDWQDGVDLSQLGGGDEADDRPRRGDRGRSGRKGSDRAGPDRAGAEQADEELAAGARDSRRRPERGGVRGTEGQRARPPRDQDTPHSAEPISARSTDRAPPRRDERPRPRRDDDDGPRVVGLGDHIPGFLMRPVKVRG